MRDLRRRNAALQHAEKGHGHELARLRPDEEARYAHHHGAGRRAARDRRGARRPPVHRRRRHGGAGSQGGHRALRVRRGRPAPPHGNLPRGLPQPLRELRHHLRVEGVSEQGSAAHRRGRGAVPGCVRRRRAGLRPLGGLPHGARVRPRQQQDAPRTGRGHLRRCGTHRAGQPHRAGPRERDRRAPRRGAGRVHAHHPRR